MDPLDRRRHACQLGHRDSRGFARRLADGLLLAGHDVLWVPTRLMAAHRKLHAATGSKSDPVDTVAVAHAAVAPAACSLRCAINKYLIAVYAVIGVVAAVARVLLTARTGSGQPISGSKGLELKAITAAARGGCVLKGGKGTVGGTLLAVALLGALENGLTVQGVNAFWQNVAQGALLVLWPGRFAVLLAPLGVWIDCDHHPHGV
ncbi:ABC transporter permease subunit [Streptomyces sp. NPDC002346]